MLFSDNSNSDCTKSDRPIRLDSRGSYNPSPMAWAGRTSPELKPTAAADSSWPQLLLRDEPNAFTADIGPVLAVQASDAAAGVILLPLNIFRTQDQTCQMSSSRLSHIDSLILFVLCK